jgi:RNA polymerase sigma-70 factor (ECF subfamily)
MESEPDDRELIHRVAAKDRQAFEALYQRYGRRLFGYLWRRLRRREVVEEVLDDVMLVVWQSAGRFNESSRLSTWLFGIAHNKALGAFRRSSRRLPLDGSDSSEAGAEPDVAEDPIQRVERRELQEALGRALDSLSPDQRTVVELTLYEHRSYQEIAEITGAPVNTVKTRMFHARRRLAPLLGGLHG